MSHFDQCTNAKKREDETHVIECKLGLWGVESRDRDYAIQEAKNYWSQYYFDGEYDHIIKHEE